MSSIFLGLLVFFVCVVIYKQYAAYQSLQESELECEKKAQLGLEQLEKAMKDLQDLKAQSTKKLTDSSNQLTKSNTDLKALQVLSAKKTEEIQQLQKSVQASLTELNSIRKSAMPRKTLPTGQSSFGGVSKTPSSAFFCPYEGDYIKRFNIVAKDNYIAALQGVCAQKNPDGTQNLAPWVGEIAGPLTSYEVSSGKLTGRSGSWLDALGTSGGTGGTAWNVSCPNKLAGYDVQRNDKYIVNFKPYCA